MTCDSKKKNEKDIKKNFYLNFAILTNRSCISFHSTNRKNKESRKVHIQKLNEITLKALSNSKIAVVVSDVSIKN